MNDEKLICPYCHKAQDENNYEKSMHTNKNWQSIVCEHCKKMFAFMEIVKREYVSVQLRGD